MKRIFDFGQPGGRQAAIDQAVDEARQSAVAAGAIPESVQVVELEEFPMTHMQTQAVELRVHVVGDLLLDDSVSR